MHIVPAIRYRGNHLIGQSVDQPHKATRTVLGLLISNMFGGPSFMARLLPIYLITGELLFDQIQQLIQIIHICNGFVYLVISDNFRKHSTLKNLIADLVDRKVAFCHHPLRYPQHEALLHSIYSTFW